MGINPSMSTNPTKFGIITHMKGYQHSSYTHELCIPEIYVYNLGADTQESMMEFR